MTRHVSISGMRRLDLLSVVHLGHPAHSSASESRILITVSPAVYRSLNQSSLATEGHVQLSKSPTNTVAVRLIHQTVSTILILGAAGSRINTILLFELRAELFNIDRLNIATDGILHLDPVSRVLERDPLNTIAILSNHQWGSRGDRTRCSIRIEGLSSLRVHMLLLWVGLASRALKLGPILGMLALWHRRGLSLL